MQPKSQRAARPPRLEPQAQLLAQAFAEPQSGLALLRLASLPHDEELGAARPHTWPRLGRQAAPRQAALPARPEQRQHWLQGPKRPQERQARPKRQQRGRQESRGRWALRAISAALQACGAFLN